MAGAQSGGCVVSASPVLYPACAKVVSSMPTVITLSRSATQALGSYDHLPLLLLRLLLLYNIAYASSPLIREKDNLTDIPLTPSQRSLLGLDPNATPPALPGTQYVTPSRYQRSLTPRSGSPGGRRTSMESPLSRKEGAINRRQGSGSYSPSPTASPIWQRTISGRESRRMSNGGYSNALAAANLAKDESVFAPSTPSPSGRAASVGLNSRWLYERGRSSFGSSGIF